MPRQKTTNHRRESCLEKQDTGGPQAEKQRLLQGEVLARLKKIEGQVRGVAKMVEECRSCSDIVIQLAAIRAAVSRVGATVLACHMAEKIENDVRAERDVMDTLPELLALFKKFS
ncbi:MAG: metal-sensitive transcriptional regulator [Desulfurispora sp.]|uniref:metal-sensitive transcriptional regulator n=1 Tax=Desulfurispora sp. TaxID=3014275 RepID=UPI00404B0BB7